MEPLNPFQHIRVIGFDLDQTLYPKSPLIDEKIQRYLYKKIAEHTHCTLAQAETYFKERYRAGAGLSGRQTLEDLGLLDASGLVQEALEQADLASVLVPDEETNRLIANLHTQYEGVDLITGSNRKQTVEKLEALHLDVESFSHIITDDESHKSTGESYRKWLSLYPHLTANTFLYVGDRIHTDHEVPSALGINTALVYVSIPDASATNLQYSSLKELLWVTSSKTSEL